MQRSKPDVIRGFRDFFPLGTLHDLVLAIIANYSFSTKSEAAIFAFGADVIKEKSTVYRYLYTALKLVFFNKIF